MVSRFQILGALAVGSAFGFGAATILMSSGCIAGFFALQKAAASDVTTVECTMVDQQASFTLPDESPETFARLSVVLSDTVCNNGGTTLRALDPGTAVNGKVSVFCPMTDCQGHVGHPHGAIGFVLR